MDFNQLTTLVEKYLDGTITASEEQVLRDWYRDNEAGEVIWTAESPGEKTRVQDRMLARLQKDIQQIGTEPKIIPIRRRKIWMAAAAIGLVLLSGTAWLWSKRPATTDTAAITKAPPVADLLPATNKATLLLSNGNSIILDSAGNGVLAEQGSARVKKTAQGQLTYQLAAASESTQKEILYNTIFTPQGGTYAITLSDGTKVWLNTGTSLKYPTAFTGPARSVELKGEAYFEVAPDAVRPFTVLGGGQTIRVLGTHFNINTYDNEPAVRTTLLQGSVKVVRGERELLLRPGEQSLSTTAGTLRMKKDIDTAEVMAWKNGMFQ
ncbi:MAG TPA: FecR domain-containing protein, partial [Puia sp.]